jgi:hypothetical protein
MRSIKVGIVGRLAGDPRHCSGSSSGRTIIYVELICSPPREPPSTHRPQRRRCLRQRRQRQRRRRRKRRHFLRWQLAAERQTVRVECSTGWTTDLQPVMLPRMDKLHEHISNRQAERRTGRGVHGLKGSQFTPIELDRTSQSVGVCSRQIEPGIIPGRCTVIIMCVGYPSHLPPGTTRLWQEHCMLDRYVNGLQASSLMDGGRNGSQPHGQTDRWMADGIGVKRMDRQTDGWQTKWESNAWRDRQMDGRRNWWHGSGRRA